MPPCLPICDILGIFSCEALTGWTGFLTVIQMARRVIWTTPELREHSQICLNGPPCGIWQNWFFDWNLYFITYKHNKNFLGEHVIRSAVSQTQADCWVETLMQTALFGGHRLLCTLFPLNMVVCIDRFSSVSKMATWLHPRNKSFMELDFLTKSGLKLMTNGVHTFDSGLISI